MREIKFRAWDKELKQMVYDVQATYDGLEYSKANKYINVDVYDWMDCFESWFNDRRFDLMQYTEIKDKNGVEIYEGDIVKFDARSHYHPEVYAWEYETKGVGIIRYEMSSYVLGGREEAHILESLFGMLMNYEEIEMEVIGNIYEDSNLIK